MSGITVLVRRDPESSRTPSFRSVRTEPNAGVCDPAEGSHQNPTELAPCPRTSASRQREINFGCLKVTQPAVLSSSSENGWGPSPARAIGPPGRPGPRCHLGFPSPAWDSSPPHEPPAFPLSHLQGALCCSPFFSSPPLFALSLSVFPGSNETAWCSQPNDIQPRGLGKTQNRHQRPRPQSQVPLQPPTAALRGRLPHSPAAAHLLRSPLSQTTAPRVRDTASCQNKGPCFHV